MASVAEIFHLYLGQSDVFLLVVGKSSSDTFTTSLYVCGR